MKKVFSILLAAELIMMSGIGILLYPAPAHAAAFTESYLRLDRMKASTNTTVLVVVKPATTATEADVQVTLPSDFTVSSTASNHTVATTNLPTGVTAWPGIATATAVSSQTITFPSTDLVVGTLYGFRITGASSITTGSAGSSKTGTITTRASGPSTIDTSSYATAVITDDQIVVTAVVPPNFSFALSGNTDVFSADLSSSAIRSTAGKTVTIATNAQNGWYAWVKDLNAGLTSATAGETIATAGTVNGSPSTLSAGTSGYVLDVDLTTDSGTGDGTTTIDAEYNGSTTQGGTLSTTFQPIASSDGTTDGDVLTLIERAAISAVVAAATDYTDTLTVVGAGRF